MSKAESRYTSLLEAFTGFLLIFYPSAMFAVKGGMNGSFLPLLLISLAVLAVRPLALTPVVWNRDMTHYLVAMSALPFAIFLSQSFHQHYDGHPYDAASRFLLAVPVFMLLHRLRFRVVAVVQYGFPLAAIIGYLMLKPIAQGRSGIATLDLIHFGDFELVLGVLSLFSMGWTGRDTWFVRVIKIAGFLTGIYASIASGSRGGWIALPVFLLIYLYSRYGKISLKVLIAAPLILAMTGFLAYNFSHEIQHRLGEVTADLTAFEQGNPDTATGVRLQLYQAALDVIAHNPVFGVGPEGFAQEMDARLATGELTSLAAELGKGEVHNELLSKSAGLGIFGLTAMLLIYLVPLRLFYRSMRSASSEVRQSGMLGLVFVSGFMVFGLTVEVLNLTMAAAFYSLTVAVLLAACLNIHHGEHNSPDTL